MLLSDKQKEILAISQEECAEVVQAVSKIFRFGIDESHEGVTNRQQLTTEVGDLLCMIELMIESGMIERSEMMNASGNKRKKLQTWSNIFKND
jgi:NTP pyrophosphatase (non-canonical NTP hydrolase)